MFHLDTTWVSYVIQFSSPVLLSDHKLFLHLYARGLHTCIITATLLVVLWVAEKGA